MAFKKEIARPTRSGRIPLGLNRRDFLRTTVVAPAAVGALYFGYQRLEGGPIRAALVGGGKQGREALIRQSPVGHIQYAGFLDVRPSQIELTKQEFINLYGPEKAKKVRVYADWKELLADRDVQAVVIATPIWTHAKLAIEAMSAGKHVYCESLMADNILDAKAMVKTAHDKQRVLAIGHQRAGSARYQEAARTVASGSLGDVKYIETFHHQNITLADPAKPPIPSVDQTVNPNVSGYASLEELAHWRLYKRSTGMLGEYCAQQFDALRVMLGDQAAMPNAVEGSGGKYLAKDDREVEDHVFCTFQLPNEVVVTWAGVSSNGAEGYGEMLLGSRGTLWFTNEQNLNVANPPAPPPPGGVKPVAAPKGVNVSVESTGKGLPTMYSAASAGFTAASDSASKPKVSVGFTESLQKFAAAVRHNAPSMVGCTGEQGLQAAVTALAAERAVREKKRVVFDADWFKIDSSATPDAKPQDQSLAKQAGLTV